MAAILDFGNMPSIWTQKRPLIGKALAVGEHTSGIIRAGTYKMGMLAASAVGKPALIYPSPVSAPIWLYLGDLNEGIISYFSKIAYNKFVCADSYIYNDYTSFSPTRVGGEGEYALEGIHSMTYSGPNSVGSYPSSSFRWFNTERLGKMADAIAASSNSWNLLVGGESYCLLTDVDFNAPLSGHPTPMGYADGYLPDTIGTGRPCTIEDFPIARTGRNTLVHYDSSPIADENVTVSYGHTVGWPGSFLALPYGKVGEEIRIPYRLVPSTKALCSYSGGPNRVTLTRYASGTATLPVAIYAIPVLGTWSNQWPALTSLDPEYLTTSGQGGWGGPGPLKAAAYVNLTCPNVSSGDGEATGEAVEGYIDVVVPESRLVYIFLFKDAAPNSEDLSQNNWKTCLADELKRNPVGGLNMDDFIAEESADNIKFWASEFRRSVHRKATLYIKPVITYY